VSVEILFPLVLGVAIVETVLSLGWNGIYFRWGIPIFRTRSARSIVAAGLPEPERITAELAESRYTDLQIRRLDEHTFAVREGGRAQASEIAYTPVMRGVLRLLPGGNVEMVGNLNWFPLVFAPLFATLPVMWAGAAGLIFPAILIGLLWAIYGVQARRFREVVEVVTRRVA
jgi:hypothetical protein